MEAKNKFYYLNDIEFPKTDWEAIQKEFEEKVLNKVNDQRKH
jgi:hypothetical protein